MRSFITRIVFFGALMCLTACETLPPHNRLDAGARQHIKTVDSVLIAKQDRIGADISQNNTLSQLSAILPGPVVLPALVDIGVTSVRSISANKHAKPMRETLKHHDYAWEFRKQIRHALANSNLEGVEEFALVREEFPGLRGRFIQESDADAVLIVDMKYAFTPQFDKLYVTSYAMLFPKNPKLRVFQEKPDKDRRLEFSDNIYRNQFAATLSTGIQDGSKAENAAYWAELSEEELVDLLERAGLLLSDTMANDINLDDVESDLDLVPEGYVLNTERGQIPASNSKNLPISEDVNEVPVGDVEAKKDLPSEASPEAEEIEPAGDEADIEAEADS